MTGSAPPGSPAGPYAGRGHNVVSAPLPQTLFSEAQISRRVSELATAIAADPRLTIRPAVALVALSGAFVFAADLLRELYGRGLDLPVDFIGLSSYGAGTTTEGTVRLTRNPVLEVTDRTVLLIDDIIDSGHTLNFAVRHFTEAGAAEVVTCVLLDKPARRVISISPDYAGFECPDEFVVGYGMDFAGDYRGLPYVGVIRQPQQPA
ncbi:MAG: phosphoribosyltransferase [Alphaproteobacteria bacterium]